MKKLVLFLLLLSGLSSKSQTSFYHPFPDSNAVWNMSVYLGGGCFFPFVNLSEDYSYILSGDTIINTITYHKINIPFVQFDSCSIHTSGYKGSIRQDTIVKKVYYIYPNDTSEQLLYDFNLQIGDTIEGIIKSLVPPHDTVISIDSILIGTSYRKRWFINPFYSVYIIEGIGSTYGLIEPSPGLGATDFADCSIVCFSQNGQTLYPDTTTSCEVILDVKNISENNFSVSVSPNPFHSSATFMIKGDRVIRNVELKIYNVFGEYVSTKKINGESAIIDRKNLADGIYFYQLVMENERDVLAKGKFVIE